MFLSHLGANTMWGFNNASDQVFIIPSLFYKYPDTIDMISVTFLKPCCLFTFYSHPHLNIFKYFIRIKE